VTGAREGLARSVQVRLAQHARTIGVDPNLVLTRYAQWQAFLGRNRIEGPTLQKVVAERRSRLTVPLAEVREARTS
jgi:hypothetical protein